MAKSEWEVVKNPKTTKNPLKPANGAEKKAAKVETTKTNGVSNGTKAKDVQVCSKRISV